MAGFYAALVTILDFLNDKKGVLLTAVGIMLLGVPFLIVIVIYRRDYKQLLIGVLLMATVVAGSTIMLSSRYTSGPTAQPSQAPPVAQVEFSEPGATMQARQDVPVAGSVAGLAGDTLWIVSSPEIGGQYYVIGQVADRDGQWRVVDPKVGDDSDKGHNITFSAVQANRACSDFLTTVPQDPNGIRTLPKECVVLAKRAIAVDR